MQSIIHEEDKVQLFNMISDEICKHSFQECSRPLPSHHSPTIIWPSMVPLSMQNRPSPSVLHRPLVLLQHEPMPLCHLQVASILPAHCLCIGVHRLPQRVHHPPAVPLLESLHVCHPSLSSVSLNLFILCHYLFSWHTFISPFAPHKYPKKKKKKKSLKLFLVSYVSLSRIPPASLLTCCSHPTCPAPTRPCFVSPTHPHCPSVAQALPMRQYHAS